MHPASFHVPSRRGRGIHSAYMAVDRASARPEARSGRGGGEQWRRRQYQQGDRACAGRCRHRCSGDRGDILDQRIEQSWRHRSPALVAAAISASDRPSAGTSGGCRRGWLPACEKQSQFAYNSHKSGSVFLLRERALGSASARCARSGCGRRRTLRNLAGRDRHRCRHRRLCAAPDEGDPRVPTASLPPARLERRSVCCCWALRVIPRLALRLA
jgi:hypothetical protein